jgi:Zn-dependent metalloprotease
VLVRAAARVQARAGLAFGPRDAVEDGGLYFLPWNGAGGLEYRLVFEQVVKTEDPPANWLTYVDALNGDVLWRTNRVRHVISGRVTGDIHPYLPTDAYSNVGFKALKVFVGPQTPVTDALGDYSASAGGTVAVIDSLIGLFCDVNNVLPSIAVFNQMASNPSTVNINWNDLNSDPAERDAYYHAVVAHDFIKTTDPGFTNIDYAMPALVNINLNCNAFWDGNGINFYRAGNGCPNTASMPDVVYHEYGHGINDRLYEQAMAPGGMGNSALHEGMADVTAAFIQDDPVIGKGFFGPNTSLRTLDNTRRWPEDASGDPHITGQIIGGAFWDLRQWIGFSVESLVGKLCG